MLICGLGSSHRGGTSEAVVEDESEEGRQAWFRNMWESGPEPPGKEAGEDDEEGDEDAAEDVEDNDDDDFGDDFDDFAEGDGDEDFGDFDEADEAEPPSTQPQQPQHSQASAIPPSAPDILAGLVSSLSKYISTSTSQSLPPTSLKQL